MGFLSSLFGNTKKADEYFEKGSKYAIQQKLKDAIREFIEAIRLNPKHAKAHMGLCMSYGAAMEIESAKKHFYILQKLNLTLAKKVEETPAGMLILKTGSIIQM
jgi:Tfp pilus assembly protein PilF